MAASDVLVSTQWVADHGTDQGIKLVEVDVDTSAYGEGHPAAAIGWNWTSQLQDQTRRDIITKADLEKLLGESGISNSDTVVLYGDNNNWFAAYTYWYFLYYGHDKVKLLNGPREKWIAEGRDTTTDVPSHPEAEFKAKKGDDKIRAYREEVQKALGSDTHLVDVRSPQEYSGELIAMAGYEQEGAQRGGHIPGSANVPWAQAVKEDGTFKAEADLRALYAGKGVTPEKEVIAYCRIGERSSHTWFVLKHLLGYNKVRNYDGSWTEWGSMIDVPVAKP